MQILQIESGIPIPHVILPKAKTGLSESLSKMRVGDSFVYPNTKEATTSVYNAIKHVRNYRGESYLSFKSKVIDGGKRRWWRLT